MISAQVLLSISLAKDPEGNNEFLFAASLHRSLLIFGICE